MTKNQELPDPFTKLEPHNANIKALFWGPPGSGKTFMSLQAPGEVAYISLESGADRYASLGISATYPQTLEDIGNTIRFLRTDQIYDTVVIDSISVLETPK